MRWLLMGLKTQQRCPMLSLDASKAFGAMHVGYGDGPKLGELKAAVTVEENQNTGVEEREGASIAHLLKADFLTC